MVNISTVCYANMDIGQLQKLVFKFKEPKKKNLQNLLILDKQEERKKSRKPLILKTRLVCYRCKTKFLREEGHIDKRTNYRLCKSCNTIRLEKYQ